MVSPLDMAALCNWVYEQGADTIGTTTNVWTKEAEVGGINGFYAAKFKNESNENVIVFRGSRMNLTLGAANDWGHNALHLVGRESTFVEQAKNFVHRHYTRNLIVAGHSLGGFLAVTMSEHFTCKVVAFNPP